MQQQTMSRAARMAAVTGLFTVGLFYGTVELFAADAHTTSKFEGAKANSGTATHGRQGNHDTLTWSDDFRIPDTPAPHWQVVDAKGNVYLLNRLKIKGGVLGGEKENRTITIPAYIHDVAKVQIYCAWAEALLGEASFPQPIALAGAGGAMRADGSMRMDSMKHDGMAMGR